MHIITVSHPQMGDVVKFKINLKKSIYLTFIAVSLLVICTSWITYNISQKQNVRVETKSGDMLKNVENNHYKIFADKTENQLTVISEHIGRLSANLLRLNALGEQLIAKTDLDPEEFNFSEQPGVGGPLISDNSPLSEVLENLSSLEILLNKRFQQLSFLKDFFHYDYQKKTTDLWGSGKPIKGGWVSSFYGYRVDPFTGKKAWHNGVDIAGREGSEVFAVASGVVSLAQDKGNYGKLVEIKHPNGLTTRYAHNKDTLVKPGDLVKKGDVIALMGSTGRSTGPHVHLEVIKNNKSIDPGIYFADLRRKT